MADLKKWFKCAFVRAAKTFCQTLVALTSACVSLLTSTYGLPECKENEIENKGDNDNDNRTNH